jgi:hypothetical protein
MSFRLVRPCPLASVHHGQNPCWHHHGETTNPSAFIGQRGGWQLELGTSDPGGQPGSRRINCRWAAARPLQIEAARFLPGQAMRVPATPAFVAWEASETSFHLYGARWRVHGENDPCPPPRYRPSIPDSGSGRNQWWPGSAQPEFPGIGQHGIMARSPRYTILRASGWDMEAGTTPMTSGARHRRKPGRISAEAPATSPDHCARNWLNGRLTGRLPFSQLL